VVCPTVSERTLLRRGFVSPNYITSVMSRRPLTATKLMPTPGALVIAIAIPPSKANTPTTAAVDRLTFVLTRSVWFRLFKHFLGQFRMKPTFQDSRLSVR
jgi:hypothetical protein